MVRVNSSQQTQLAKSVSTSVIVLLVVITLYFNPKFQDPFNASKQIILIALTAWNVSFLLVSRHLIFQSLWLKRLFLLILLFDLLLLISTLSAPDLFIGFFGEELRRNGFVSYLCLTLNFICIVAFFPVNRLFTVIWTAFFIGLVTGIYGLIQSLGKDFVSWNNPYNSIISTVGNPNFASALYAIVGTIIFLQLLSNSNISIKLLFLVVFSLVVFDILKSQSRQGIVALLAGVGTALTLIILKRNKKLGIFYLIVFLTTVLFSILGMLQKGPLQSFLYKDSVSVRGYYWRAAIKMFLDHPFFGVGMDSYGLFFKEYRDVNYSLRYGYSITSSNAHSLPLQLLSTSGMFSILIYLSIILVISFAVYRSYKSLDDSNFINFVSIFGGWIAYQAQSLISIDQIGVGIWNWVLGGLIIAIGLRSYSHNNRELISQVNPNKASLVVSQRIYGFLLVLTTIIPISLLVRGEIAIYKIRGAVSALYDQGGSVANRQETNQLIDSFLELNLQPNYSRFLVSRFQAELKLSDEGLERVKNLSLENPRNLDYLGFLAFYYENSKSYSEVLKYRLQIKKYDPYNLANLLIIGQIYKAQGNSNMSSQILNQINSLAPNSEISKSANSLLS